MKVCCLRLNSSIEHLEALLLVEYIIFHWDAQGIYLIDKHLFDLLPAVQVLPENVLVAIDKEAEDTCRRCLISRKFNRRWSLDFNLTGENDIELLASITILEEYFASLGCLMP